MTCAAVLMLTIVILFIGTLLLFGLIPTALAILALCLALIPLALILSWRYIYPWLVRMGRWAARPLNLIFLIIVLLGGDWVLRYVLGLAGISVPTFSILGIQLSLISLIFVFFWLLLLLLGTVVLLVRLWRYGWPRIRNVFWDVCFRIVGLFWRILVGVPLGIVWFFYNPPLRWLMATGLFYLRGILAAVAWFLYNPPLREIIRAGLFIMRLIARFTAWLLYNPPLRWVAGAVFFSLMLIARVVSTIFGRIWATEFAKGVSEVLRKGLTRERKSYQDYKYAHDDGRAAA
jgi:hypothetical protein